MRKHSNSSFTHTNSLAHADLSSRGCPHFAKAEPQLDDQSPHSPFNFGLMFDERREQSELLTELGVAMGAGQSADSNNGSGYTYLGQFIAHEITFDKTRGLPKRHHLPVNHRSPQIDLDSLYGNDADPYKFLLYDPENPALLRLGHTIEEESIRSLPNDLFRSPQGLALIADPRNDENLAVAQIHVALIRFHNAIAKQLQVSTPAEFLLERTRAEVVKHFQWVILNDYLRTVLDNDVLRDVLENGPRFFKPNQNETFMPLEFSAAAFRMGHSMVRNTYHWNHLMGEVGVNVLFEETNFSGTSIDQKNSQLFGRWIIDWRRFFNFDVIQVNGQPVYKTPDVSNKARRIDTIIEMKLETIGSPFPHAPFTDAQKSIAVRNLLRGDALQLPCGEKVASWIGEVPLTQAQISAGFGSIFASPWFRQRTPLWFYVLREAEVQQNGDRMGRLGSRIMAETFFTLIKNSRNSIINEPDWRPRPDASRTVADPSKPEFHMVDLLHFADVVNPIKM